VNHVNRDTSFERLIRRALQASTTSPRGECLDAATVAALADATLPADERTAAEAHAADCERCQALLAAMARSAVDPAPVHTRWWRAPAVRWLAPITAATAAATALVVWSVTPDRSASKPAIEDIQLPQATTTPTRVPETSGGPAGGVAGSTPSAANRQTLQTAREDRLRDEADQKTSAPADAVERRSEVAPSGADAFDRSSARALGGAQERAKADASAQANAKAIPQSEARRSVEALHFTSPISRVITSPDMAVRWRLLSGGRVERSTDAGSTWQAQDTGVTVTLTAGASPAPSTCWLVGPGGVVLVSTDGSSWKRAPFPEGIDLTSVRAADDKTAIVTASDGGTFKTQDGGQTWARTPPQDF
jgi:hypothetical protein